jgi:hypothetical protein
VLDDYKRCEAASLRCRLMSYLLEFVGLRKHLFNVESANDTAEQTRLRDGTKELPH